MFVLAVHQWTEGSTRANFTSSNQTKTMMKKILENKTDIAVLVLRITVGLVIFAHGAQKLFGWFGGYGFTGTLGYFTGTVGLPYIVGFLVIIGESIGMIALVLGLLTRFSALSLIVIMGGAFFIDHLPNGFYMNWFGQNAGEGFEFDILIIGASAAIAALGAGRYSVDAWINQIRIAGNRPRS
jgi:putative oxidoreductase